MPSVEKVSFVRFDQKKFPKHEEISGRSPFATTSTEGPSYVAPEKQTKPQVTGALNDKYGQFKSDSTPLLGSEFSSEVRIKDILNNPDQLKDLAILISQRGVVFFRDQDDLTVEDQKKLVNELGLQSGKPKTSGLHIHPVSPAAGVVHGNSELIDPEVSFISSRVAPRRSEETPAERNRNHLHSDLWHSDITFEPVPADYSSLRLVELPENGSGGDTLWANGYALLEKFSPSFRAYLETLTGTYAQPGFNEFGKKKDFQLYLQPRGAPENVGDEFIAHHPIVRTNPVTGWKSLFAVGAHFAKINEVSPIEAALLKKFILDTLVNSHDIQVRFKWNKNDVAIWDNRSTYHSATNDYWNQDTEREGIRTVGIAERPFLDPNSTYQSESLAEGLQKLNLDK